MRVNQQARHLLAAFAVLGLLFAPVAAGAPKHTPEITRAELKKLKNKVAALEKSVKALSSSLPPGYSEKASTQALQAAVADFEKNTEAVSGGLGLLKGPLGGVLTGTFPANVQIVDGSIVGADIAPETILGSNIFDGTITGGDIAAGTISGSDVDSGQIQLRGATSACMGTDKVTGIFVGGDVNCSADLGSRGTEIATSTFEQPRVVNASSVFLNYAVMMPFVVTELVGGVDGQRVTLIAANSNVTVLDTGVFRLSAIWAPNGDDTLTVVKNGMSWYEVARSAN